MGKMPEIIADAIQDRNAFVVVLLDGDGMIFNEDLLQQGEKGGKEAASALWSAANDFVQRVLPHLPSPKILARIYANVKGLGDVLQKTSIIDRASLFEDFARGFNGSKLLFDFIDVGTGKDKADDKITGQSFFLSFTLSLEANEQAKKSSNCIFMMSIAIKFCSVARTIMAMLDCWMIPWETRC